MRVDSWKDFTELCELRSLVPREISTVVLSWLRHSTVAGTFHVFKDGAGRPTGYVAWADINREAALRLAQSNLIPRYGYEWKEGRITLILDLVIVNRGLLPVREALKQFLHRRRAVALIRRGRPRFYLKKGPLFERMRIETTAAPIYTKNSIKSA